MTTREKFTAAVNVIRNLPKNGAFQPSTELQLKFYSYFKQATEGPNTKPKPSIWDVPGGVKWRAWKKLGNMSEEEAMNSYIEELKSIVETMSYNANVETFLSSLGPFYDCVPAKDVDLVFGPVIEKVKSRVTSPITSRDPSPGRKVESSPATSQNGPIAKNSGATKPIDKDISDSEDDDEFADVIENIEVETNVNDEVMNFDSPSSSSGPSYALDSPVSENPNCTSLQFALQKLQVELSRVTERVSSLENAFVANSINQMNARKAKVNEDVGVKKPGLFDLPLTAWGMLILWPVATNFLINYIRGYKRT